MSGNHITRRRFLGALGITAAAGCTAPTTPPATEQPTTTPTDSAQDQSEHRERIDYSAIYANVIDHVVSINTISGGNQNQGTGWVYSPNGAILTNEHLTHNTDRIDIGYSTGEWTQAEIIGEDPYTDLAVITPDDPPPNTASLSLADYIPAIGDRVVAVGNPFGLSDSMSQGIVSGTGRAIRGQNGYSIPDVIQTDASLNPGNSGGPLVSVNEKVLGIVNAGLGNGVGFAVSWRVISRVVPSLLRAGHYEHTRLGISIITMNPLLAQANNSSVFGVYVSDIAQGAPADGYLQGSTDSTTIEGIEIPIGGDIITAIDGEPIPNSDRLSQYLLLQKQPGDQIQITVIRDNQKHTTEFEIGVRPPPY